MELRERSWLDLLYVESADVTDFPDPCFCERELRRNSRSTRRRAFCSLTCHAGGAARARESTRSGGTGPGRGCAGAAVGYGGFWRLQLRLAAVGGWQATAERVVVDCGRGGGVACARSRESLGTAPFIWGVCCTVVGKAGLC